MEQPKRLKAVHADDDVNSENESVSVQFDAEGRFKIRLRPTWKRIGLAGVTVVGGGYWIWDICRKLLEVSQ